MGNIGRSTKWCFNNKNDDDDNDDDSVYSASQECLENSKLLHANKVVLYYDFENH